MNQNVSTLITASTLWRRIRKISVINMINDLEKNKIMFVFLFSSAFSLLLSFYSITHTIITNF